VRCVVAEVEEMVRLSVRVPVETRDELTRLAAASGLKMSAFLAAALVIGGRQLARQTNPEVFVTPELLRSWLMAMGMDIDQLAKQVGKGFDELLAELKREDDREGDERAVA
jgi:hypothetical protein